MTDCSGVKENDRSSVSDSAISQREKKSTALLLHIDKSDSDACLLFSSWKIKGME